MKNLLSLTLLALGLSVACTQSPTNVNPNDKLDNAVSFTYSIDSKVDGNNFEADDQISVFAYENDELSIDNTKYTFDGSSFESVSPIVIEPGQELAYLAVYPYTENLTNEYTFTIAEDQSAEGAYEMSDLLAATTTPSGSRNVKLKFDHKLSNVVVNLSSEISLSDAAVYVNAFNSVECNFAEDTFTATGYNSEIEAMQVDDDTFAAIVAPQTIPEGSVLASAVVGGTQYDWTAEKEIVLLPGKRYTIDLTLEEAAPAELVLSLDKATDSDIFANIDMNGYTGNYFVACMEKALYDAEPYNSDPVVAAGKFMYMEVDFYERSLEPGENPMVFNENQTDLSLAKRWEILPEKEYIVFAFGIDAEGEVTTDVQFSTITTEATAMVDPVQIAEAAKTQDSFTVSATPGATTGLYTIYAVEKSELDLYKINNNATEVDYLNSALAVYPFYGVDYSVADGTFILSGDMDLQFNDMKIATTYTVLACAVSPAGVVASEVNTIEITTENAELVDGSLVVSATATTTEVTVDVAIDGEVGNYMLISMDAMTIGTDFGGDFYAAAKYFASAYASQGYTFQVDNALTFDSELTAHSMTELGMWTFYPGDAYYIMAFGVTSGGAITTEISLAPVVIPEE